MIRLQSTALRGVFEALAGTPSNEWPSLDESVLSWVLPLDASFAGLDLLAWRSAATTINAATATFDDNDATLTFDLGEVPLIATTGRFYWFEVNIAGGTTGNIEVQFARRIIGAANYRAHQVLIANNPGEAFVGPIYFPPRVLARVANVTQGGLNDTMAVRAFGFQHPAGQGIPIMPALASFTT